MKRKENWNTNIEHNIPLKLYFSQSCIVPTSTSRHASAAMRSSIKSTALDRSKTSLFFTPAALSAKHAAPSWHSKAISTIRIRKTIRRWEEFWIFKNWKFFVKFSLLLSFLSTRAKLWRENIQLKLVHMHLIELFGSPRFNCRLDTAYFASWKTWKEKITFKLSIDELNICWVARAPVDRIKLRKTLIATEQIPANKKKIFHLHRRVGFWRISISSRPP